MKKTKVVHFTSVHPFGDVRVFHKECVSLVDAGYEVIHIVPNAESGTFEGVQVISIDYKHTSRLDRMRKTTKLVYQKCLEVDADIYHFHDPELLRVGLKLKRKGKKVIYDVHEDVPRQILSKSYINGFIRRIVAFSVERLENYVSKRLDVIITATPFINDRFLKINKNSVNVNNFPMMNEIEVKESHDLVREIRVCYIGVLSFIRGINEMVEAVGIADVDFQLAGTWQPGVEDKVSKIKGWNKVEDLGFISRATSLEVKSKCIAGLVLFLPEPNHVNAQPNKLFEYMASGLPVIASNFPLWKAIIEDNDCGLCVDPHDPKAIAKAITFLKENPQRVKEMGANGRKMVAEKYNWDIEKIKLLAVYKSLA